MDDPIFADPMPPYIKIGDTTVGLERQTDEHMGRYWRAAGAWNIMVIRNPDAVLRAIHEEPFPESIGDAPVTACTKAEHDEDNARPFST